VPIIDIQQLSKLYYSIGEVAELLDVNASLLRFWEKEFQFEIAKKNDGAKKALKSKTSPTIATETSSDHSTVIHKLEQVKARLVQLKSTLPSTDQAEVKASVLEQKVIQITEATPKKPATLKSAPSTDMPSLFD